jgi:hypothetical protein
VFCTQNILGLFPDGIRKPDDVGIADLGVAHHPFA